MRRAAPAVPAVFAVLALAGAAASGCTVPTQTSFPGGASAGGSASAQPGVPSAGAMSGPGVRPTSAPATGGPGFSPSPTNPSDSGFSAPAPAPTDLPLSVAASPGAALAVLPDARTGTALNAPFTARGVPLINRNHAVSGSYAPKIVTDFQLQPEANSAFATMVTDAKKAGAAIIWRVAYRSYATQTELSKNPPTQYGDDGAAYVAVPGQSEHQAGLAVDVASNAGFGTRFPETKEFAWMRANSYKYGWILRYPEGKTAITGYNYEPWHYRYVGPAVAAAFGPNSNLTLEEYVGGR